MAKFAFLSLMATLLPAAAWAAVGDVATPIEASGGLVLQDAAAPTQSDIEASFRAARESYRTVAAGVEAEDAQGQGSTSATTVVPGGRPENTQLEQVNLIVDAENRTLQEVVADVVAQAAVYTGPWTVKWRLKPENEGLMNERVNLTAEASLGTFFSLLSERVRNMTGTQLFITVFGSSRVILVADTYY